MSAGSGFCNESARYLRVYLDRIRTAVGPLDEAQLWWRPGEGTNSVANLLLHLEGNLTQWLLAGIGGAEDGRRRSLEFDMRDGVGGDELIARLSSVVGLCAELAETLPEDELPETRTIQGYDVTVLEALYHAVEHMSYHTGQIVYAAKQLLGPESGIDFYPQHRGE